MENKLADTPGTILTADDSLDRTLSYRWSIFAVLAGGYILVYFHRLCPAVVAIDMMHDLRTGGTLLGLLGSAYFYPYALMQLPAGLLADHWGPRRTITLFSLIACGGSLLLALAPTVGIAILGRTLVGVGVAMLFVPTMKVLTEWFRPREFTRMTGILLAMGGVGSLISTTPLALLTEHLGWRPAFIAVAGLTMILAALVWTIVRDRPADLGWAAPVTTTATTEPAIGIKESVRMVLHERRFRPLAAWFFFQAGIFFAFGGLWGGPYLRDVYSLDRTAAGQLLSLLAIGLIIGSPLQTWLSNRVFKGRKPALVLSASMTFALTLPLAFMTGELPHFALALICLFLGIFTSAAVVVGFVAAKELFPTRIAGTAIGLVNFFPFAGGALLQPLLGYILERHGRGDNGFPVEAYQQAFSVLVICAIVALVMSLRITETFPKNMSDTQ